jgi:diguanylate cyclase
MFSLTLLIILGGCLLGAVQLMIGVAIGMWLRRPETAEPDRDGHEMAQASLIAQRLQSLAGEMSSSVGEHRAHLDQASQKLVAQSGRSGKDLADLVVEVIGGIVRANHSLQSKLETAESQLQDQARQIEAHISRALTDPLTGLPNRREFNDRLEERMALWNRHQEPFALLLLDVDHFKRLNDEHGHVAGDQVLATIAQAMRTAIRREDSVARYGGEEFAFLLPKTTLEQALHVAEKVRGAVSKAVVEYNGRRISVTASGGFAAIQAGEQAKSLIERADCALYAAKAAGRNCSYLHDGSYCRSTADAALMKSAGASDQLVDAINSSDAPTSASASGKRADEVDAAQLRREISAELAQTCDELRRFVEERTQYQPAAPTTAP